MYKNWIALWTLINYGLMRYWRSAMQYILPPIVTNVLYFTIFGKVIGGHLGTIDGVNYVEYLAPGLIMMTVITSTVSSTLGSVFYSKFCRSIEEIIIAPIPTALVLIGLISVGMLRGLINGVLVTIIASFYVPLNFHHFFIAIITALLTAMLFALIGFTNALYAKKWDDISLMPTFIITPLTYLGGVFFSIKSLPPIWQHIALYNPILYIINAFRYSLISVSDISISRALSFIVICVILMFAVNYVLLRRGVGVRT